MSRDTASGGAKMGAAADYYEAAEDTVVAYEPAAVACEPAAAMKNWSKAAVRTRAE